MPPRCFLGRENHLLKDPGSLRRLSTGVRYQQDWLHGHEICQPLMALSSGRAHAWFMLYCHDFEILNKF